MVKKLILVTSPPACGKTYISKALAKRLQHVVYLDKDTLITLSKQIFVVAGQPYDRSSDFFEKNIRDYEYECVVDLAMEALDYDDIVLINAPFTQEIRDTWKLTHWDEYIASCDFSIPENLDDPKVKDDLILFQNNNEEEFEASMQNCLHILEETMKG